MRNVVLVGHSGSGKTTLVEALLSAGTGNHSAADLGRMEDSGTVSGLRRWRSASSGR